MGDTLLHVGGIGLIGYFFWTWLQDYHFNVKALGAASPDAATRYGPPESVPDEGFPGATPVGLFVVAIAVIGSLAILAVEVIGEYHFNVVDEQTTMNVVFGLFTLAAAFAEELIFRGFLVYDKAGRWKLYASIVAISFLFAVAHPYIWTYERPAGEPPWFFWKWIGMKLTTQTIFTTGILFVNSLWWYCVRFFPLNPYRSLIPCIAAHFASNLGVFAIKACQGKVELF